MFSKNALRFYYQLVQFIVLIGFAVLAYYANEKGGKLEAIIFIALTILFQPITKIALGKTIWNIVDVVVGIALLLSIFIQQTKKEE